MKIIQIINVAIKNIVSNKLRSILTMLGLMIGIASVIVLILTLQNKKYKISIDIKKNRRRTMATVFERKINYYETDKMGVVHHSNYIRFFGSLTLI